MKCQKVINFLDNTPNQPTKFKIKNWVKINDLRGKYNLNNQPKFQCQPYSRWEAKRPSLPTPYQFSPCNFCKSRT